MHGADLHIETAGAGEPAIVLVHAGIADSRMWDPQFAALAASRRVVRYDVRGFGRSPDGAHDYYDHEDLVGVMDACGLDRAVLVGASNGGRIVLDTAVTAPDRVTAMMLAGAPLPGLPVASEPAEAFAAEDAALEAGDVARAKGINLRLWVDGEDRDAGDVSPEVRARIAGWLDDLLPRQVTQAQAGGGEAQLVEPLVRDRLGQVRAPALVIVGRHDVEHMRATARHLATALPHAELVIVEGAAHLPSVEQPARFDELLHGFLAALHPRQL